MCANRPDIRKTSSAEVARHLEDALLSELRSTSEQGRNTQITLEIRGDDNDLLGGLIGSTSYGWLLIKVLWVDKAFRNLGYGRDLVERAIRHANLDGCHSVWLDTSDENARQFYQKLGFDQFGMLENMSGSHPEKHRRYFLEKRI